MSTLTKHTVIYNITASSASGKIECNTLGTVIDYLGGAYNIGGYKVLANRIYNNTMVPAVIQCPVQLHVNSSIYCTEENIQAAVRYVKESYNLTMAEHKKELAELLANCKEIA